MQHFGIIASPVSHSLSPKIYSAAFKKVGIEATFVGVEPNSLADFFEKMRGGAFDGVAVSHPFKEPCMAFLDEIDPIAQQIGAVNTVKRVIDEQGVCRLVGYNTDWLGVQRSIEVALTHSAKNMLSLKWKSVLVLGAGGVARSSIYAFTQAGAHVTICNRTEEKGRALAERFGAEYVRPESFMDGGDGYNAQHFQGPSSFDVVFQGTSVGMSSDEIHGSPESPLPISFWENYGNGVALESIYAPKMTRFLSEADRAGWNIVTADHLFVGQAVEQFRILTGKTVEPEFFEEIIEDS